VKVTDATAGATIYYSNRDILVIGGKGIGPGEGALSSVEKLGRRQKTEDRE